MESASPPERHVYRQNGKGSQSADEQTADHVLTLARIGP